MINPRMAYMILETERDEQGYIPCIAVEGETGYHRTSWNYGQDLKLAQECVDGLNERMGISKKEALVIQLGTMRSRFAEVHQSID